MKLLQSNTFSGEVLNYLTLISVITFAVYLLYNLKVKKKSFEQELAENFQDYIRIILLLSSISAVITLSYSAYINRNVPIGIALVRYLSVGLLEIIFYIQATKQLTELFKKINIQNILLFIIFIFISVSLTIYLQRLYFEAEGLLKAVTLFDYIYCTSNCNYPELIVLILIWSTPILSGLLCYYQYGEIKKSKPKEENKPVNKEEPKPPTKEEVKEPAKNIPVSEPPKNEANTEVPITKPEAPKAEVSKEQLPVVVPTVNSEKEQPVVNESITPQDTEFLNMLWEGINGKAGIIQLFKSYVGFVDKGPAFTDDFRYLYRTKTGFIEYFTTYNPNLKWYDLPLEDLKSIKRMLLEQPINIEKIKYELINKLIGYYKLNI